MDLFQFLNGRCPVCGEPVGLIEGLVYEYMLGEDGYPVKSGSQSYRAVGYCTKCNEERLVMPNADGSYTVFHPDAGSLPYLLHKNTSDSTVKQNIFNLCSTTLETMHLGDGNPFVAEEEPKYDCEVPF